eukprot:2424484-Amphidinium_carterae.1
MKIRRAWEQVLREDACKQVATENLARVVDQKAAQVRLRVWVATGTCYQKPLATRLMCQASTAGRRTLAQKDSCYSAE